MQQESAGKSGGGADTGQMCPGWRSWLETLQQSTHRNAWDAWLGVVMDLIRASQFLEGMLESHIIPPALPWSEPWVSCLVPS